MTFREHFKKGRILTMEEFIAKLIKEAQERLGDNYSLEQVTATKTNNQKYTGSQVRTEGNPVSPVFYVQNFYKDYLNGKYTFHECLSIFIREIKEHMQISIDTTNLLNYDHIKDDICVRLINYEANEELLKELPHFRILDLAAIFYYRITLPDNSIGTMNISHQMLETWEMNPEDFINTCMHNFYTKNYVMISDIKDALSMLAEKTGRQFLLNELEELAMPRGHLFVLTGANSIHGACMLLHTQALHQFATEHNDNMIIYPSSVHECLIAFESDEKAAKLPANEVAYINQTMLEPEERLSNSVYLYDRHLKELRILYQGISLAKLDDVSSTIKKINDRLGGI